MRFVIDRINNRAPVEKRDDKNVVVKDAVLAEPAHPYTKALIAAAPIPDPRARRADIVLEGDVPSPLNPPSGCHFHTRCPFVMQRCRSDDPPLRAIAPGRAAACHLLTAA